MSDPRAASERRFRFFFATSAAVLLVCLLRAAHLSLVQADWLSRKALQQHSQRTVAPPERGPIVARDGTLLAVTVEAGDVYVRPREFNAQHAAVLASVLGVPTQTVLSRTASQKPFVWIARQATREQVQRIRNLQLPGVGVEDTRRRVYPFGTLAGQVLGTVGVDLQGLAGAERAYDRYLRSLGDVGRIERDGRGSRLRRDLAQMQPSRGPLQVELTIDATLQRLAEDKLREVVQRTRGDHGLVIILDPHTGEVLALAQYPFFDPNEVGAAATERARIRAITDPFEPGSTFKALIAAAAIEDGVVKPEEKLYCERGRYRVGKHVVRDHKPYGWLTFADVIRHSSNICTAKVGERLGAERLYTALERFGLHRSTGIDLPGEKVYGLRPWSAWARIHLVTTSFGQGVAVTPIQLASAYAALANGGKWVRPHVVRRVTRPDGTVVFENRPVPVDRVISQSTASIVTQLLEGVVENGTGTKAQVRGVRVAGKTGTAQKVEPGTGRYSPRARIASFVGSFPADAPRYLVLVVVDTPRTATYGGLVAAPVFHEIAESVVDRLGLRIATAPPIPPPVVAPSSPVLQTASWSLQDGVLSGMPSFIGLSLREALHQARVAGWEVEAEGWGFVVDQDPLPGASAAPRRKLRLRLAPPTG